MLPVDDLPVRVVRVLRAEGRVSDQALEHDRSTVQTARNLRQPLIVRGDGDSLRKD